jgi:1-acyl-sn-glycerol-3-phosphate acyltransferase
MRAASARQWHVGAVTGVPESRPCRGAKTPLPLRLYRYARVSAHVFQGIATTAIVFPLVGLPRRQALIRQWSKRLLVMMRIEARVRGMPASGLPGNILIVANHISWLDIFVLNTLQPARFIAKAELKQWPLVGLLIKGCGTLFIERERRRDAHRVNEDARLVLAAGDAIAIFPEGTTTDGTELLPFHGSLLQPVIDAAGHLQPVAIRYQSSDGSYNDAPAYVGDMSFMASFWRVLGERSLVVDLTLPVALPANNRRRRDLSRDAEALIRTALALSPIDSAPGTRADRPA